MSKLLSQGGFGCVFYPGINCDGSSNQDSNIATKVQKRDFNSQNEADIGQLIMNISGYDMFFLPVVDECSVNIRKAESKSLQKCEVIKDLEEEYVAMDIPYIKQTELPKMLQTLSAKDMILTIVESYRYLLMALDKLINAKIVHFDLKLENVLFKKETTNPRIIDFGISIPIDKLDKNNMKDYFYIFAPDYYVWCPEICVISFLLNETDEDLTSDDIDEITELHTEGNRALDAFSEEFRHNFKELLSMELREYIGVKREKVIETMLSSYETWDNYSLSVMFLRILTLLFPTDDHKNKFVILFSQILLMNIHPNPNRRLTIKESQQKFNDIFMMDGDVQGYLNLARNFESSKINTTKRIEEDINHLVLPKTKS
jgi:serine/threonine protein kinase